jgi:hypothetical protein
MDDENALIPPPALVRDKLGQNIREGRLLRSLYRLSLRAAREEQTLNEWRKARGPAGAVARATAEVEEVGS